MGIQGSFQWLKQRKWVEIALFTLILSVSLLVRVEDLKDWKRIPRLSFYKGEPILTTFDGYYYLRLARDVAEGTYEKIDDKRIVPESPPRPFPPPLLSLTAGLIAKITPFSINWVGALLPAFLGLLLAIPLYNLGKFYGGLAMGLAALPTALLFYYYVYRSSLGWFDTDCMNVTWTMAITYYCLRFATERSRTRYFYFSAALVCFLLFLWWWDQAPQIVTAITAVTLFIALAFFYRPKSKEGILFYSIITAAVIAILWWKGPGLVIHIIEGISEKYGYIAKKTAGFFPNPGIAVSEQVVPKFNEIISITTNSAAVLFLSALGLVCLFWRRTKESLFLVVPMMLGSLSLFFARRFLIFLAPIVGLGLGFLVSYIWALRQRKQALGVVAILLVIVTSIPAFYKDMKKNFMPKESSFLVQGMVMASEKTPENAVIWTLWDNGYPMMYWARRGTIADGQYHGPQRVVYNMIPFASKDYRLAANFINFFVARGVKGIQDFYASVGKDYPKGFLLMKEILGSGPGKGLQIIRAASLQQVGQWKRDEDWLRFFFPKNPRPVFLFLDYRLMQTIYWWYYFGNWDPGRKEGVRPSMHRYFKGVEIKGEHFLSNNILSVDLAKGIATVGGRSYRLKTFFMNEGTQLKTADLGTNGYTLDFLVKNRLAIMEDSEVANCLFCRMFYRNMATKAYFTPIILNSPYYQLWEVKGDKINKVPIVGDPQER